jgi:23S rRNA (cytidine2498-2'-O)-methyltransferase
LDVGASPGGWTWVLSQLGAEVLSVDRSELDPRLMRHPRVSFVRGNAFSILPGGTHGRFDWIVGDIACYPEKLLDWIQRWLAEDSGENFICTLKFQGDSHYGVIKQFAQIPGSRLLHLYNNKHELTWIRLRPKAGTDF